MKLRNPATLPLPALVVCVATCLGLSEAFADTIPLELDKSIKGFAIAEKSLEHGALRVVFAHPVVNQETYSTFIRLGVCAPLWDDAKRGWRDAKIDRVEVLNKSQGQGFAFIGGRKACMELGHAKGADASKGYLADHTWICVAGFDCRPRRPGEKTSGDE